MKKRTQKGKVAEKYLTLDRELAELYQRVTERNPFFYRNKFEEIQEKYFSNIGKDNGIDFNLAFAHLTVPLSSPNATALFLRGVESQITIITTLPNSKLRRVMRKGLIDEFADPVSIAEAFDYLKRSYKYYNNSEDSRFIARYIMEGIYYPAEVGRVSLLLRRGELGLIQELRTAGYVNFWENTILRERR